MTNEDAFGEDRRSGTRFKVSDFYKAKIRIGDQVISGELKSVSLSGCMISVASYGAQEGDFENDVKVFFDLCEGIQPMAYIAYINEHEANANIGLVFRTPLTAWALTEVAPKLGVDLNYQSRSKFFVNQKSLALADLEHLHTTVTGLKSQQFHMTIAGIPMFSGLITASLVLAVSPGLVAWWNICIPIVIFLLSIGMLAIFLQKNCTIRRKDAFCHTLQTHLSLGSFPVCYRGWRDAYANYNHLMRFKGSRKYDVPTVPDIAIRVAPSDMFSIISIIVLLLMPLLSASLIVYISIEKMYLNSGAYMAIGAITVSSLVFTYWAFIREFRKTRSGDGSYRALLIRFDKILHHAPPFNPCSVNPLK